jgi:magnesium-transporting ATPase (P-type)
VAFVPVAVLGAGLSIRGAVVFAVGLLAGNVPEGLLPVITLALAVSVTALARRGALVKRLSAVETLGSTDVICTDKTGTLTENRMRPMAVWTSGATAEFGPGGVRFSSGPDAAIRALAEAAAACNNAFLKIKAGESVGPDGADPAARAVGDPTEVAVLAAAHLLGADTDPAARELTMSFLGMIAGQIGTAFAVRTEHASLRSIGVFSNLYLLAAVGAELLLAAVFVYTPPLQALPWHRRPPRPRPAAFAALPADRVGRRRTAPLAAEQADRAEGKLKGKG